MIDLHGLHRAEAVSILTREFPERRARGNGCARARRDGASHEKHASTRAAGSGRQGILSPLGVAILGTAGGHVRG